MRFHGSVKVACNEYRVTSGPGLGNPFSDDVAEEIIWGNRFSVAGRFPYRGQFAP